MDSVKIRVDESDISIQEKQIHDEIEKNLEKLEPGLVFIEHKPRIGTGEIDTLQSMPIVDQFSLNISNRVAWTETR